jgi:hypothetical protein
VSIGSGIDELFVSARFTEMWAGSNIRAVTWRATDVLNAWRLAVLGGMETRRR